MHQERAARAAYEVADAQYRSTVLTAFKNVADALQALQFDAATLKAQQRAVRAASETFNLTSGQYRLGAVTYIILLNAQRIYEQALLALVQAQAARFADTAALFAALGGGWWNRIDVLPISTPRAANRTGRERQAAAGTNGARQMIKRMVIMLAAVAVVFGIFGFQAFKTVMIKKFISGLSNPPQTISAAKAATSEWQSTIEAIGSLRAVKGADLSLEVSGVVELISFNSGDDVVEGAQLLKLRTADDVARLNSLQAMADLSDITYERDQKQFKMQAVSQATLDTDAANLKNAKAQVAQQQAIIDKKLLRAPFSGHLGIRAVDLGQYLGPGTVIVTLQARQFRSLSTSSCRSSRSIRCNSAKLLR